MTFRYDPKLQYQRPEKISDQYLFVSGGFRKVKKVVGNDLALDTMYMGKKGYRQIYVEKGLEGAPRISYYISKECSRSDDAKLVVALKQRFEEATFLTLEDRGGAIYPIHEKGRDLGSGSFGTVKSIAGKRFGEKGVEKADSLAVKEGRELENEGKVLNEIWDAIDQLEFL